MRRLRLWFLRHREAVLLAEVENGRALMRNHAERLRVAEAELARVQRLQMAEASAADVLKGAV